MTTDLKSFSPLVPIIDNSKSSYSISLNRNDNNNNHNSETNSSNSIRTISFKDLSRQILNNKNSRLPHTNTFILTDSSGKKYALKTASNNMTGSTATFSANTTANSNTINNSNTNNTSNNSNPNSAGTNQKSSEMANQNTDNNNNNNNNSGGSNSTTTTMSEMVNAIEELRRENERIINELGATQEMLDLFERYRELIHKHMDNCICAGKDHFFNQWKRMEVDYVNLLPSSNRKRFKNESSAIHQQDPSSLFDMNRHSNHLMLKNPKLRGNFPPQNFQSRWNGMKRSNHHFYSPHSNSKFDVTLRMVNNTEHSNNHAHHHVIDNVNSSSTSYSQPRHSMGGTKVGGGGAKVGGKSLVRTFLDKIRPVNSINGFNKFPSSSLMLNSQTHSSSYQSPPPPPPVSFISQGSNILIRKRSAAYPHEIFYNKNGSFSKKFRQDPLRISALNANVNKKHSKNDRHTSAADQEVERLDKLNNALDQILLGRFDALAQLETNNSHDEHHLDNDEDLSRAFAANSLIMDCDLHQDDEDEDDDVDDDDDDDESDANEEGEDREEDEDDDDENDSNHQQNIKNNVIVMKSNHNQNGLKEELNDEDDNIDEVDDEQEDSDSQIHLAKTEQSTILSAVLKSGLKPYNNFRKMNGNMINNKNGQIATIQVNPTTVLPVAQIKIANNNVMKENSLTPVAFTTNNSKSTIDLHQPPPPKPVSPSPQGFRQRPHLTNEERTDIINRLKSNESGARIARDYGITKQAVSAIKRRAQLMGDNFQSKYYTTPSPAPMASSSQQTSGNVPKNQSSPILTTPVIITTTTTVGPNSQQAVQQQPSLVDKQPTGPSTITINLATTSTGGFSFVDNSLVSRQLKQQKVNATIMKQSNLLAQLPRSTSDLVLPVNTVAILKSKIAAQQKQQQANPITAALLNNSLSANTNLKTNIEVDPKRLILPRLLQGTEAYTPTYVTTNNSSNTSVNLRETAEPDEDVDNNNDQQKKEVDGDSEKNPQTPNRDNNEGDSNDEENIQEPDHDSDKNHANNNDEESEEEEEEVNQDIKDNNADDDNFNQDDCIEISDGEDHSDDDRDEPESAAIDDPTDETSQEHPESNDDEREDFEDDDDAQHDGDVQESNHQIEQVTGDSSDEKDRSADGSEHMIQDGEDSPATSSLSFENSLQSMEFISE